MSEVWFTSDTHFGHANVIKFSQRPFLSHPDRAHLESIGGTWPDKSEWGDNPYKISPESLKLMDDALIDGINAVVGRNDTLYHLGDFHFSHLSQYVFKAQEYRTRIRCRNLHLIWGNHDQRSPRHPLNKAVGMEGLFSSAQDILEVRVGEHQITLCHYAMVTWNKSHRGAWHLYGHSHSNAEAKLDHAMPGRRSMDVGVDNAKRLLGEYRPFHFDEIKEIMKGRTGSSIDHHADLNTSEEA